MARKSPSFGQRLAYMTLPERVGPAITHNLTASGDDLAGVHREFLDNFRYLPPRKNGNVLYHEVLSFSDLDRTNVTPSVLEGLTKKYLELRAPYALAFAQSHFDTDCPHVHIMISANNCRSTRRLRLSRAEFSQVKRSLEKFQRQQYPFLQHSVVLERDGIDHNTQGTRIKERRSESERSRRLLKTDTSTPSRKQQIHDLVAQQLVAARSAKGLYQRLKILGLHLYKHGKYFAVHDLVGNPESAVPGRRYRLRTLGLDDTFKNALRRWQPFPERLMALEGQELEHEQQLWQSRNYQQQIQDIMALHSSELSPQERDRLEQIHQLRASYGRDQDRPNPDR